MKQTAVEWLVQEMINNGLDYPISEMSKILEQAKAIEKEQIMNAYVVGYTQCQEDMVKDFLLLIKEYKDKELPNCNKPFHHEAEISSGLDGLVNYIKNKQD